LGVLWIELSWEKLQQLLEKNPLVILPVGSIEQHGPHLPVGVDLMQAEALAKAVAVRLNGLVAPSLAYGYSFNHMRFAGTVTVTGSVLEQLVIEVGSSLAQHGVKKLLILNSHGGNGPALRMAVQVLNQKFPQCRFLYLFWLEFMAEELRAIQKQKFGTHADEIETSMMLLLQPNLVEWSKCVDELPDKDPFYLRDLLAQGFLSIQEETVSGVLGEASYASADKGRTIFNLTVDKVCQLMTKVFS
jgi:creatinine amidohydrolase